MKRYIKNRIFYKVYYQPKALEFYFDWKPTIKDLKQLAYLEDLGWNDFQRDEFEVTKIQTENENKYQVKLRML